METLTKLNTYAFGMGGVVPDLKDVFEDASDRICDYEMENGFVTNDDMWEITENHTERTLTIKTACGTYVCSNMKEHGSEDADNYVEYDLYTLTTN